MYLYRQAITLPRTVCKELLIDFSRSKGNNSKRGDPESLNKKLSGSLRINVGYTSSFSINPPSLVLLFLFLE